MVWELEQKPFYSPTEFAKLIDVDPSTVLDWIHRDRLFALKLGPKTFRIPLATVMSRLRPEAAMPTRVAIDASELAADERRREQDVVVAE